MSRGTKRSHSKVGDTRLHKAVRKNNWTAVSKLIDDGASVDARDENGRTPLHVAASNKNLGILKLLIKKGANLEAKNEHGRTPLFNSNDIDINKLEIAEELIAAGADVNTPDNYGNTFLSQEAEDGNKKMVELLIKNKADLNLGVPLYKSLEFDKVETAKLLINAGADVNLNIPLKLVVELQYIEDMQEITELLIEKGADVNAHDPEQEEGRAALHDAVKWNNFEFAESLLKYGANVNIRDASAWTPLHYSVYTHGDDDLDQDEVMRIVKLLVKNGMNVNARDNEGNTALHIAAKINDIIFATYLVEEAGADVTIRDSNGKLFYQLDRNEESRRLLLMLYNQYESYFLSRQFGRDTAGVLKY